MRERKCGSMKNSARNAVIFVLLTAIVLIVAELTGWGQQEHGKT